MIDSRPRHRRISILVGVLVFFCVASFRVASITAAPPPQKKETAKLRQIRSLLALTGAARLGRQIAVQLIAQIRSSFPKVPEAFWRQMILDLDVKSLVREIALVYDRHLTSRDVAGLIAFYKSPLGRRFVKLQPKLLSESMVIGRRWGRTLSQQIVEKMRAKGYFRGRSSKK